MMGDNAKPTTVAQRIEQLIESSGLKTGDFANRVGIQKSAVSHLTSGRNKPSFEVISNMLIAFPELNPDWLILGIEPMLRDANHTDIVSKTSQKTIDDEAILPLSSQKDLLNDLESTDTPPMFSKKRKDSIKDAGTKSNTSVNNKTPLFGNSSVTEAHDQEQWFDVALPSSTPPREREKPKSFTSVNKIPDVIILQPDGRYFRYRAIEE